MAQHTQIMLEIDGLYFICAAAHYPLLLFHYIMLVLQQNMQYNDLSLSGV